jgi:Serine carboxypeptidase S28
LINVVDTILLSGNKTQITQLKTAFGMETLTYDDDFANVVSSGLIFWQSRNWDPAINSPTFSYYCGNITSQQVLWPQTSSLSCAASTLIADGGWANQSSVLTMPMLNLIGFLNETFLSGCEGFTLDECWGSHNASAAGYTNKDVSNYGYLSWPYQFCTQFGFLQTGSGVPKNQLSLISRLVTLEYESLICEYAFNITTPPDTQSINKYGGFNISYNRLAIIGGEADPWRPATPLATLKVPDRLNTTSTMNQPVILIEGAVHHWDENGLFPNETTSTLPPAPVKAAQASEVAFVKQWMEEWNQQHCRK